MKKRFCQLPDSKEPTTDIRVPIVFSTNLTVFLRIKLNIYDKEVSWGL